MKQNYILAKITLKVKEKRNKEKENVQVGFWGKCLYKRALLKDQKMKKRIYILKKEISAKVNGK